jgi:hypothetical protein
MSLAAWASVSSLLRAAALLRERTPTFDNRGSPVRQPDQPAGFTGRVGRLRRTEEVHPMLRRPHSARRAGPRHAASRGASSSVGCAIRVSRSGYRDRGVPAGAAEADLLVPSALRAQRLLPVGRRSGQPRGVLFGCQAAELGSPGRNTGPASTVRTRASGPGLHASDASAPRGTETRRSAALRKRGSRRTCSGPPAACGPLPWSTLRWRLAGAGP